ncbi:MAG: SCO family protein [Acidobacteriota bacterium]
MSTEAVDTTRPDANRDNPLRRLRLALWALALLGLCLFGLLWLRQMAATTPALPNYGSLPSFALLDQRGTTVTLDDLEGTPWIADFIFTSCPGVCPILTERMAVLDSELPSDAVRLVSFSVDPERDRPEVLAEYAAKHDASARWTFLTGTQSEIESLVRDGFMLPLDPSPREEGLEPIVHSNRFVLVDADGHLRGFYNAFDAEALKALRRDLQQLVD